MAPGVLLTIESTPPLPMPPRLLDGQLMVESLPSFHTPGAHLTRNSDKFWVVAGEGWEDGPMGPMTTGKYRMVLPANFGLSAAPIGESEPAKSTTPDARSGPPLAGPPPP